MNVTILKQLCCPICKGELSLIPFLEENVECLEHEPIPEESKGGRDTRSARVIKEGVLLCSKCSVWYPIYAYVPVMLVFTTHFHKRFAKEHASPLQALSEYSMPKGQAQLGEQAVQETFTDEWHCTQNSGEDDALSFLYSLEDLIALQKKTYLKWVKHSPEKIHSVLELGCGLGAESKAIQAATNGSEVFAVDLNFALFQKGESFKAIPGIHLLIASLFQIPFKSASFDLVYSAGVIHHTFSTVEAFKSIASYSRTGGHLFIWVYGLEDHLVRGGATGLLTRAGYLIEGPLRPLVSRSPKMLRDMFFNIMTVITHPLIKSRVKHKDKWKHSNTNHDLRDWLSPRYAHRHSYNEVFEWFENLGFQIVDVQSPRAFRQIMGKRLWGVGMTGEKTEERKVLKSPDLHVSVTSVTREHSKIS